MQINGLSNVSGVQGTNRIQPKSTETNPATEPKSVSKQQEDVLNVTAQNPAQTENVTFSGTQVNGIRYDLVNRIRAEIAAGTYDTEEKMNIALERMLDSLGQD
ncbi:MAG: hypothetical protein Q4D62_06645 [Planctomycetia bacterium]|nr:hypothetical protein [Planctomycetia bacterium]